MPSYFVLLFPSKTGEPYNLARMEEAELVSELVLMMLRRQVIGKTQSSLDRIYNDKDRSFPEQEEVSRRFRIVMETIEDLLGEKLKGSPFARKTLFFSLFAFLYDYRFGFSSDVTEKLKPKSVNKSLGEMLIGAGDKISQKIAPDSVLEATARRTTHPSSRKTIVEYLWDMVRNGKSSS